MADFKRPERVKNALDNRKLNLTAECPSAPGRKSSLIWGAHKGKNGEINPRITVYTNDPNDNGEKNGYGKIMAAMDLPVFYALLQKLKELANMPEGQEKRYKIENKNFIFPGGKRSAEPVMVSETFFGRDKEGNVWISIVDKNKDRPKIKFCFAPPDFHHFVNADGTPLTTAETSRLFALGYVRLLELAVAQISVDKYEDIPTPPRDGGGNGGRGNYGGGGNGGGYNRGGGAKPDSGGGSDMDDDLPF